MLGSCGGCQHGLGLTGAQGCMLRPVRSVPDGVQGLGHILRRWHLYGRFVPELLGQDEPRPDQSCGEPRAWQGAARILWLLRGMGRRLHRGAGAWRRRIRRRRGGARRSGRPRPARAEFASALPVVGECRRARGGRGGVFTSQGAGSQRQHSEARRRELRGGGRCKQSWEGQR